MLKPELVLEWLCVVIRQIIVKSACSCSIHLLLHLQVYQPSHCRVPICDLTNFEQACFIPCLRSLHGFMPDRFE